MPKHAKYKISYHVLYAVISAFVSLVLAILAHTWLDFKINSVAPQSLRAAGLVVMFAATGLLWWVQTVKHIIYSKKNDNKQVLAVGPYKYSRHPAYASVLLLMTGFGLVLNSVWIIVAVLVTFMAYSFVVIPYEERLLKKIADASFADYQKSVRMWL